MGNSADQQHRTAQTSRTVRAHTATATRTVSARRATHAKPPVVRGPQQTHGPRIRVVPPLTLAERDPAPSLPTGSLIPDPVPPAVRPQQQPLIRVLMPLVMVFAMVGMVVLMVITGRARAGAGMHPGMMLFPVMMGMGMLAMFLPQPGEDTDEQRRVYMRHLDALRSQAAENAHDQRVCELYRAPDPRHLVALVPSRRLWERAVGDPDALQVRLGLGPAALCTPVEVPDSGATEDLDPVCAVSLRRVVHEVGSVPSVPVVVQLGAFRFLAFSGAAAGDVARALVAQLVFHHGPELVSVTALGAGWEWLKWLPHARSVDGAVHRVLVVDSATAEGAEDCVDDPRWTTIIDVGSRASSVLGSRAQADGLAFDCGDELQIFTVEGNETIGEPDRMSEAEALVLARALAACRRPVDADRSNLPRDFLGLVGLSPMQLQHPDRLWDQCAHFGHLTVPIGVAYDSGAPVLLDMKESALGGVGPHGLCIGATGSGKSELLKTLVLALAATHDPDELNFVLVDFKGGATFLGLEQLPHTSAVITNLAAEQTLVERMHDAVSGEMNRRQEVLRTAGNFANVTDYNAARMAGRKDLAPLPSLVIVVDEFSELLGQHPDFADLFVAVGRLGRSLHMHLLLASQRLEEGRLRGLDSHLSYRIGLKTFSAAESRQVLGVSDAYQLPACPGAGYLRTDAESLVRFQAAYVSGKLPVVSSPADGQARPTVRRFHQWIVPEVADTPRKQAYHPTVTLLESVVAAVHQAAGEKRAHQIWLPPLPPAIPLANVVANVGKLACVVGIIDRPYQQRQDPLVMNFSGAAGHAAICGSPRTGKTTFLRTLVLSLALTHTTDQLRFYILDFGGAEGLAGLSKVPHVAGVASRSDPERVRRVVDEVLGLLAAPEHRHTFLLVNGWHAIATEFEDLVEPLNRVAADGLAARVHLVVTTARWTNIRPVVRDLLQQRVELRLAEPMDSVIDRKAQLKLPQLPGRGLTATGEHMLVAISGNQDVHHVCQQLADQPRVPALRVLPQRISRTELPASVAAGIPFGVGGPRLETLVWNSESSPHLVCFGSQGSGKSTLLGTLMAGLTQPARQRIVLIDPRRTHLGAVPEQMLAAYCATTDAAAKAIAQLGVTLRGRLPGSDITPAELHSRSWWAGPDIFLVIDDYDVLPQGLLQPVVEYVPHARDIGLHVVVARKSGGAGRALFDALLSAVKDQSPAALILDADREEGALFGVRPVTQPPGRGTWVVRGNVIGVGQVAQQ
ncbi:type VII secretion protein EccCa [Corynebacterium sp.]|uniref:type VII secretion protein EccCa n=1 Tax=Corynebacterium sp. TaxID=1720 RepID=UPI0026DD82C3|nr:type VII secretion protein EccCa [Corynebacterium sp.]MDO5077053.1 type VII secretion protein EccCa [Corynebacterium sp.]